MCLCLLYPPLDSITPHKRSSSPAGSGVSAPRKAVLWDSLEPGCCTGKIQHPGDEFTPKPTLGGLGRAGSPQLLLCQPTTRGDGCDVPHQGTGRRGWGFPAGSRLAGTCWDMFIPVLMPQHPVPDCSWDGGSTRILPCTKAVAGSGLPRADVFAAQGATPWLGSELLAGCFVLL